MNQWGTEWEAEEMTQEAQSKLQILSSLVDVEGVKFNLIWGFIRKSLRPNVTVPKKPKKIKLPTKPELKIVPPEPIRAEKLKPIPLPQKPSLPPEPNESSFIYQVENSVIDIIFRFTKKIKQEKAKDKFNNDHKLWVKKRDQIISNYEKLIIETEKKNKRKIEDAELNYERWEKRKERILKENAKLLMNIVLKLIKKLKIIIKDSTHTEIKERSIWNRLRIANF